MLTGAGLDIDEYVRRSYKFAYADGIEVGPVACLPEPPDLNNSAIRKPNRQEYLWMIYNQSFGHSLSLEYDVN